MTDQFIGHYKLWEGYKQKHPPMTGPPKNTDPFLKPGGVYTIPKKESEPMVEQVDHPSHYGGKGNPYETIKVLENTLTYEEFLGFCKGSAIKYLDRAKAKDLGKRENQDYEKAQWYLNYMNDFIKRENL